MAEEGDSGEKTHAPSGRRISESRGQGMVAKSADLAQVLSMITSVLVLERISPVIWQKLQTLFRWGFTSPFGTKHWEINELKLQFITLVFFLLPDILILMGIVAFVGSMTTLIQTDFLWTSKLLQPKNVSLSESTKARQQYLRTQNMSGHLTGLCYFLKH